MRRVLTGYAGAFNRRHRRRAHVFQNRYKSIAVEEERYFLEIVRYLHLNPLRAGMVADLDALDCFPWSQQPQRTPWAPSAPVAGHRRRPGPVPPRISRARASYRVFVKAGSAHGRRAELRCTRRPAGDMRWRRSRRRLRRGAKEQQEAAGPPTHRSPSTSRSSGRSSSVAPAGNASSPRSRPPSLGRDHRLIIFRPASG
jgi:hypothetical protein